MTKFILVDVIPYSHGLRNLPTISQKIKDKKDVVIEDDVWLGANVVVLPGVKIGKGSVIGANSLVNKDIAPLSLAVGSPAKIIKKRLNKYKKK